jgi:large subunit ribosomal protein L28
MARKATLGGKAAQTGNNVSHSHRKTKHRWLPNMQERSLYSMVLDRFIRLSLPTCVLRSVDHVGGLDNFLLKTPADQLERPVRELRKLIVARSAKASPAA